MDCLDLYHMELSLVRDGAGERIERFYNSLVATSLAYDTLTSLSNNGDMR